MKLLLGLLFLNVAIYYFCEAYSLYQEPYDNPIGLYYGIGSNGAILWTSPQVQPRSISGLIDAGELMKETKRIEYRVEIAK